MVFLKEFLEKVGFEKNQQTTNIHAKLPNKLVKIQDSMAITEYTVNSESFARVLIRETSPMRSFMKIKSL